MSTQIQIASGIQDAVRQMKIPSGLFARLVRKDYAEQHPYIQTGMLVKENHENIQSWDNSMKIEARAGLIDAIACQVVITLHLFPGPNSLLIENYWNYWGQNDMQKMFDDMSVQDNISLIVFNADTISNEKIIQCPNTLQGFFKQKLEILKKTTQWSADDFKNARARIVDEFSVDNLWNLFDDRQSMDDYEKY